MSDQRQATIEAKLQKYMPPNCTLTTAWKSWQPRILNVYIGGPLGYTPPPLPAYVGTVKLLPVATAFERDSDGEIQRIHLLETVTQPALKIAQVRQWLAQQNLDLAVAKKGGNYVFMKDDQVVARYKVKETTPAQLDEMKAELDESGESCPRYDERVPMEAEETVWTGYTYLLDGQPTLAPRTMTVAEWLEGCPPGSVICKCDVFGRGLVKRKWSNDPCGIVL